MECNCDKRFNFKWSSHVRKYNENNKMLDTLKALNKLSSIIGAIK